MKLSTLRNVRIAIFTLSLAIPFGIGCYVYWQENIAKQAGRSVSSEETKEVRPESSITEKSSEYSSGDTVAIMELDSAKLPDTEVTEAPSAVVQEDLGRHQYHSLESVDNRAVEVQILYVTDAKVFIRREDKRIFEVNLDSFNPDSQSIILEWDRLYADAVTSEQKSYLANYNKEVTKEVEETPSSISAMVEKSVSDDALTGPYAKDLDRGISWELVDELSDEFEKSRVDEDKWQIEPRGNGWSWIGRAPGLFLPENVSIEDGKLTVTVSKLPEPREIRGRTYLYQGAIVRSIEPGQPGWYYECKMKANETEMSSTFWLMTKGNTVKKLETDIQECVGVISPNAEPWADGWDRIYHSNLIHRENAFNPENIMNQKGHSLKTPNHKKFYVYGAWWKSESEVLFYLDGEYIYTLTPSVEWDVPAFIQMAIETYDWNPVPERNSRVERAKLKERKTQYEWVRVWRPEGVEE